LERSVEKDGKDINYNRKEIDDLRKKLLSINGMGGGGNAMRKDSGNEGNDRIDELIERFN